MKKRLKGFFAAGLAVCLCICFGLFAVACKDDGNDGGDATVAVTEVTLDKYDLNIEEGKSEKLTATVNPDNATDKTVIWNSSNPGVATVSSDGTVTALVAGEAEITASAGGKSASCTVKVSAAVPETQYISVNGVMLENLTSEGQAYIIRLPDEYNEEDLKFTAKVGGEIAQNVIISFGFVSGNPVEGAYSVRNSSISVYLAPGSGVSSVANVSISMELVEAEEENYTEIVIGTEYAEAAIYKLVISEGEGGVYEVTGSISLGENGGWPDLEIGTGILSGMGSEEIDGILDFTGNRVELEAGTYYVKTYTADTFTFSKVVDGNDAE